MINKLFNWINELIKSDPIQDNQKYVTYAINKIYSNDSEIFANFNLDNSSELIINLIRSATTRIDISIVNSNLMFNESILSHLKYKSLEFKRLNGLIRILNFDHTINDKVVKFCNENYPCLVRCVNKNNETSLYNNYVIIDAKKYYLVNQTHTNDDIKLTFNRAEICANGVLKASALTRNFEELFYKEDK